FCYFSIIMMLVRIYTYVSVGMSYIQHLSVSAGCYFNARNIPGFDGIDRKISDIVGTKIKPRMKMIGSYFGIVAAQLNFAIQRITEGVSDMLCGCGVIKTNEQDDTKGQFSHF